MTGRDQYARRKKRRVLREGSDKRVENHAGPNDTDLDEGTEKQKKNDGPNGKRLESNNSPRKGTYKRKRLEGGRTEITGARRKRTAPPHEPEVPMLEHEEEEPKKKRTRNAQVSERKGEG